MTGRVRGEVRRLGKIDHGHRDLIADGGTGGVGDHHAITPRRGELGRHNVGERRGPGEGGAVLLPPVSHARAGRQTDREAAAGFADEQDARRRLVENHGRGERSRRVHGERHRDTRHRAVAIGDDDGIVAGRGREGRVDPIGAVRRARDRDGVLAPLVRDGAFAFGGDGETGGRGGRARLRRGLAHNPGRHAEIQNFHGDRAAGGRRLVFRGLRSTG